MWFNRLGFLKFGLPFEGIIIFKEVWCKSYRQNRAQCTDKLSRVNWLLGLYLERVVSEVLGTMTAANHAFRTLAGLVLHHLLPADFHSALVIAVDRLHRTTAHMTLQFIKQSNKCTVRHIHNLKHSILNRIIELVDN